MNASDAALSLLTPAMLHAPAALMAATDMIPSQPGLYGWWFDDALAGAPGVAISGGWRLLYVGIAPNKAAAAANTRRSLRSRIKDHCRGRIAGSTLRRSLAALLWRELSLKATIQNRKLVLSDDGEVLLSAWIAAHARTCWVTHLEPWTCERLLLNRDPCPPLNIAGAHHPYSLGLKRLRSAFRQAAIQSVAK